MAILKQLQPCEVFEILTLLKMPAFTVPKGKEALSVNSSHFQQKYTKIHLQGTFKVQKPQTLLPPPSLWAPLWTAINNL